jgi:hypothetical protein
VPCVFLLCVGGSEHENELWQGVALFGLGYIVGLFMILDKRPQVIINESGFLYRSKHCKVIPWKAIKSVNIKEKKLSYFHRLKVVNFVVEEAYLPSKNKGKLYKWFASFNQDMGFEELSYPLNYMDVAPDKLLRLIVELKVAQPSDRPKLLKADIRKGKK